MVRLEWTIYIDLSVMGNLKADIDRSVGTFRSDGPSWQI